jgi:hypothetical protein
MPLPVPALDNRRYSDLVAELLARVPVHTPEWTHFGGADPGRTLLELFAYLHESVLYRTNVVPERNRARFLRLLNIALRPARPAEGMAVIANERGPLTAPPIGADLELLAGTIPFRTLAAVDALPVETRVYIKRPLSNPAPGLTEYYALLYAAYGLPTPESLDLYETVACDWSLGPVSLNATTDRSMWIALLARPSDIADAVRRELGGRTLALGLAPAPELTERVLAAGNAGRTSAATDLLRFELPQVEGGLTMAGPEQRPAPQYRSVEAFGAFDPLTEAGVVELVLPAAAALDTWRDLDPLEAGVGDLPPVLEDPDLAARMVTWLRVRASGAVSARIRWAGINAVRIRQQTVVRAERLPDGDGTPGQTRLLGHAPVIAGSVALIAVENGQQRPLSEISDLLAAGPEVPTAESSGVKRPTDVFELDAEAGRLTFGDGLAGRRLAAGARLYASYAYSEGKEGNVPARAIRGGPLLPAGYVATNPIATFGGADAETVSDGERQVRRYLQHRDRMVTIDEYESVAWRAGVDLGRIDVLPAWRPGIAPAGPGSAPGAVTVMAIPRSDPAHPAAPRPDRGFLDALCRYFDPRRPVTTELIVRGPVWKGIWISVGVEVAGGHGVAETLQAVRARLTAFLSPLPPPGVGAAELLSQPFGPRPDPALKGWPLNQPVRSVVLIADAARVPGVLAVVGVLLAEPGRGAVGEVAINGIELPEIIGISVVAGDPLPIDTLRGTGPGEPEERPRLPVPVVPETC